MNVESARTGPPNAVYGHWVATHPGDWPEDALNSAWRELLDTVAVMLPGSREPAAKLTLAGIAPWCGGALDNTAHVAGCARPLPAPWAALVNGTAGHALDFDDNFDPPKAHASTVLYPAILAIADAENLSGAQVLDAYIIGLQVLGRIGQAVNPLHRNRGWHATATLGVFGAAAACARLLGLDARRTAHALSLAASMSSGFMSQFGTMAKPLHAGLAAKSGILAATLARQGLEAGTQTLDGPHGLNTLMVGSDRESLMHTLTGAEHGQTLRFELENVGEPLLITRHGFRVKRFPNCGSAHRAMDILLEIMQAERLDAADVVGIEVHAPAVHLNNLFYHRPETGLEAKFSMEYALACLLAHGACGLGDFTDQAVARPAVRAHFSRIALHPIDKLESECPTRLVVHLSSGETREGSAMMPRGSIAAPFTTDQYWEKFHACMAGVLDDEHTCTLRKALEGFREVSSCRDMTRCYAVARQGEA